MQIINTSFPIFWNYCFPTRLHRRWCWRTVTFGTRELNLFSPAQPNRRSQKAQVPENHPSGWISVCYALPEPILWPQWKAWIPVQVGQGANTCVCMSVWTQRKDAIWMRMKAGAANGWCWWENALHCSGGCDGKGRCIPVAHLHLNEDSKSKPFSMRTQWTSATEHGIIQCLERRT